MLASGPTVGCQPTVPIGRYDPTDGPTSGTGDGGGTGGPASTGDTTSTGGRTSDAGGSSGVDWCEIRAGDSPCTECIRRSCCAELEACFDDASCPCFWGCYELTPSPQQCLRRCALPSPEFPEILNDVLSCTFEACPLICPEA